MPDSKRPRVFVVDDEPIVGFTLAAILEGAGFAATSFTDPLDALKSAETDCPDYLISDVMMPVLNGIDLGIHFKTVYPNVKVLLFSGATSFANLWEMANGRGHQFDILQKPVHPEALLEAIENLGR